MSKEVGILMLLILLLIGILVLSYAVSLEINPTYIVKGVMNLTVQTGLLTKKK